MPVTPKRLPQGRGIRRGEDWYVNQGEAYRQRAALVPDSNLDFVGTTDGFARTASSMDLTVNVAYMYYIGSTYATAKLEQLRFNCASVSTTERVQVALYREQSKALIQIPKSLCTVTATAAGAVTADLSANPIELPPTKRLFLAFLRQTVNGMLIRGTARNMAVFAQLSYAAQTALATRYEMTQATKKSSGVNVPAIAYVSRFVKDYL